MASKVSTRRVTERRTTARPAGTTAPTKKADTQKTDSVNSNSTPASISAPASPASPTAELADHMAQVLTGKKKLAPTPEHLDLEAKIKKAWAEGYRGVEKREFRERDELFGRPVLKVEIGGYGVGVKEIDKDGKCVIKRRYYGPGRVLVDRLDELAAAEGYTVSVG
jgi:hypothetical protein